MFFKKFREFSAHQDAKIRRHHRLQAEYNFAQRKCDAIDLDGLSDEYDRLVEKYGFCEEGEQPDEYREHLQRLRAAKQEYRIWDREASRLAQEIDEFARAERKAMEQPTMAKQRAALMAIPGDPER